MSAPSYPEEDEYLNLCERFNEKHKYLPAIPGRRAVVDYGCAHHKELKARARIEDEGSFKHKGETMSLTFSTYVNGGSKRINVVASDGAPYATLSSNPDGLTVLEEGEFLIKTYSENNEIAASVLASGLFEDTGRRVPSGRIQLEIWRMLG